MHTIMVMLGGALLLGAFLLIGKLLSGSVAVWALYFIPVWLIAAAVNMWIGVKRAGYTLAEEFPIFLVVFAGPAALAMLVWWLLIRRA